MRWMDGTCEEVPGGSEGAFHPWSLYQDISRHQLVVRAMLAVNVAAQQTLQDVQMCVWT